MLNDHLQQSLYELHANAANLALQAAEMSVRPSFQLRPQLSIDGDKWCALYGENLQDGVAGFGDTPNDAYADFDRAWFALINKKEASA